VDHVVCSPVGWRGSFVSRRRTAVYSFKEQVHSFIATRQVCPSIVMHYKSQKNESMRVWNGGYKVGLPIGCYTKGHWASHPYVTVLLCLEIPGSRCRTWFRLVTPSFSPPSTKKEREETNQSKGFREYISSLIA